MKQAFESQKHTEIFRFEIFLLIEIFLYAVKLLKNSRFVPQIYMRIFKRCFTKGNTTKSESLEGSDILFIYMFSILKKMFETISSCTV